MTQSSGSTYWGTARVTTVAIPWLPFFSHCEGWDSHITLWDLFENPMEDRRREEDDGPGCDILSDEETLVVAPLGFDLSTMQPALTPVADECQLFIPCDYEESMRKEDNMNDIWREIE